MKIFLKIKRYLKLIRLGSYVVLCATCKVLGSLFSEEGATKEELAARDARIKKAHEYDMIPATSSNGLSYNSKGLVCGISRDENSADRQYERYLEHQNHQ